MSSPVADGKGSPSNPSADFRTELSQSLEIREINERSKIISHLSKRRANVL